MDRLQSMRVFERVVQEGGFAAAARALDMSAPAVTRLIADLEAFLGTRLLQRTTRRLSLTEAGHNYLTRVRNILQDIDEAHAVASAHTTELSGLLRLHTSPVLASYVIAPLLAEFRRRYPRIQLDIFVDSVNAPPFEDFDISLFGAEGGYDADVVARKVVESEAILVAAPGYLARRGTPSTPADLAQHDCLRLRKPDTGTRTWRMWPAQDIAQAVEVDVQPVLMANHTDTLLRTVLDGAGITSVSVDLVAAHLMRGELVRVLPQWITGQLTMYAALPSRKFIPQRTRAFLDFMIEETRAQRGRALEACLACHTPGAAPS